MQYLCSVGLCNKLGKEHGHGAAEGVVEDTFSGVLGRRRGNHIVQVVIDRINHLTNTHHNATVKLSRIRKLDPGARQAQIRVRIRIR